MASRIKDKAGTLMDHSELILDGLEELRISVETSSANTSHSEICVPWVCWIRLTCMGAKHHHVYDPSRPRLQLCRSAGNPISGAAES